MNVFAADFHGRCFLPGTSSSFYLVAPASAGVQSNKQAGFRFGRNDMFLEVAFP